MNESKHNGQGVTAHNRKGPGRLKLRHYPKRKLLAHSQLDEITERLGAITEGLSGVPAGQVRNVLRATALARRAAKAARGTS